MVFGRGIAAICATGLAWTVTSTPFARSDSSLSPTRTKGGVVKVVVGTATRSPVLRAPSPVSWSRTIRWSS